LVFDDLSLDLWCPFYISQLLILGSTSSTFILRLVISWSLSIHGPLHLRSPFICICLLEGFMLHMFPWHLLRVPTYLEDFHLEIVIARATWLSICTSTHGSSCPHNDTIVAHVLCYFMSTSHKDTYLEGAHVDKHLLTILGALTWSIS
jgi:hypothetical protein